MIKRKNRDRERERKKNMIRQRERERERARALSALGSVFTIAMNLYVHKLKDTRLQGTSGKWPELLDFVLPFFFFFIFLEHARRYLRVFGSLFESRNHDLNSEYIRVSRCSILLDHKNNINITYHDCILSCIISFDF